MIVKEGKHVGRLVAAAVAICVLYPGVVSGYHHHPSNQRHPEQQPYSTYQRSEKQHHAMMKHQGPASDAYFSHHDGIMDRIGQSPAWPSSDSHWADVPTNFAKSNPWPQQWQSNKDASGNDDKMPYKRHVDSTNTHLVNNNNHQHLHQQPSYEIVSDDENEFIIPHHQSVHNSQQGFIPQQQHHFQPPSQPSHRPQSVPRPPSFGNAFPQSFEQFKQFSSQPEQATKAQKSPFRASQEEFNIANFNIPTSHDGNAGKNNFENFDESEFTIDESEFDLSNDENAFRFNPNHHQFGVNSNNNNNNEGEHIELSDDDEFVQYENYDESIPEEFRGEIQGDPFKGAVIDHGQGIRSHSFSSFNSPQKPSNPPQFQPSTPGSNEGAIHNVYYGNQESFIPASAKTADHPRPQQQQQEQVQEQPQQFQQYQHVPQFKQKRTKSPKKNQFKYTQVNYRQPIQRQYNNQEEPEFEEYGNSYAGISAYQGGFSSEKFDPEQFAIDDKNNPDPGQLYDDIGEEEFMTAEEIDRQKEAKKAGLYYGDREARFNINQNGRQPQPQKANKYRQYFNRYQPQQQAVEQEEPSPYYQQPQEEQQQQQQQPPYPHMYHQEQPPQQGQGEQREPDEDEEGYYVPPEAQSPDNYEDDYPQRDEGGNSDYNNEYNDDYPDQEGRQESEDQGGNNSSSNGQGEEPQGPSPEEMMKIMQAQEAYERDMHQIEQEIDQEGLAMLMRRRPKAYPYQPEQQQQQGWRPIVRSSS